MKKHTADEISEAKAHLRALPERLRAALKLTMLHGPDEPLQQHLDETDLSIDNVLNPPSEVAKLRAEHDATTAALASAS